MMLLPRSSDLGSRFSKRIYARVIFNKRLAILASLS